MWGVDEETEIWSGSRSKLVFYHEDLSGVTHMLNIEAKQEYTMGLNVGK